MGEIISIKSFFDKEGVKKRFEEILGQNAASFIVSVLQVVNSNSELQKADPVTVYNAAAVAATLGLPINNNLGLAYIIPYNVKSDNGWKVVAQFQMGYKGYVQLAHRTGAFERLNVTDVREGELVKSDFLSGDLTFDWIQDLKIRESKPIIGYVSYLRLNNGFEKMLFMTMSQLNSHGEKYSKTFKKDSSLWKSGDSMHKKTPLKLLLSKWGPISLDIQRAIIADQSVVKDEQTLDVQYSDNPAVSEEVNEEEERVKKCISECTSVEALDALQERWPENEYITFFESRRIFLTK